MVQESQRLCQLSARWRPVSRAGQQAQLLRLLRHLSGHLCPPGWRHTLPAVQLVPGCLETSDAISCSCAQSCGVASCRRPGRSMCKKAATASWRGRRLPACLPGVLLCGLRGGCCPWRPARCASLPSRRPGKDTLHDAALAVGKLCVQPGTQSDPAGIQQREDRSLVAGLQGLHCAAHRAAGLAANHVGCQAVVLR